MRRSALPYQLIGFSLIILMLVGGAIGVLLQQRESLDNRQRASSLSGTGRFTFTSIGQSTTQTPGSQASLPFRAEGIEAIPLDGFQVYTTFTGNVPADLTYNIATPSGLSAAVNRWETISGGKRLVTLFVTANSAVPFVSQTGTVEFGTITYTVPSSGSMTVSVEFDPSLILATNTGQDLLGPVTPTTFVFADGATPTPTATTSATPTPTAAATPTPTPTPQANFLFRVRLIGVNGNVGPIQARVQVGAVGSNQTVFSSDVTLSHTTGGIYQGSFGLADQSLLPDSFWVAVKGSKHAQRVFNNVAKSSYELAGFDFSSKPLEPGDLPVQDGTINIADIQKVISLMTKITQTQDDLNTADVNYDGVVNSADTSAILSVLSTKTDENL